MGDWGAAPPVDPSMVIAHCAVTNTLFHPGSYEINYNYQGLKADFSRSVDTISTQCMKSIFAKIKQLKVIFILIC